MTGRTESLLAELLEVQRQQLANQTAALELQRLAIEQQRTALSRQQVALRLVFPLIAVVALAILLPYAWQWVAYLISR